MTTTFIVMGVLAVLVSIGLFSTGPVVPFTLVASILDGRRSRRRGSDGRTAGPADPSPSAGENPPILSRPLRGRRL